jgi:Arginyl tRNA synthetase N terminal domain
MMILLCWSVSSRYSVAFGTHNVLPKASWLARHHKMFSWQRQQAALFSSTTSSSSSSSTDSTSDTSHADTLYGIDWVRNVVVASLNTLFDPKEVARGNALAKLDKQLPKKKEKKARPNDAAAAAEPPEETTTLLSDEERNVIIEAAISQAKPFSWEDVMVTPATRDDFGDYQCNAAMGLAKAVGLNPR